MWMVFYQLNIQDYTLQLFCEDFKMASESSACLTIWPNQIVKKIWLHRSSRETEVQILCVSF